jgi:hypothetical protein
VSSTTWFFVGFFTGSSIAGVSLLLLWFFIEPAVFRRRMHRASLPPATARAIARVRHANRMHIPREL